jgi:cyclophilin family peptidyl-prolyl cis-trans isomerase/HEAT repeat protein
LSGNGSVLYLAAMTPAPLRIRHFTRPTVLLLVLLTAACGVPLDAPVAASRFGADSTLWMRMLGAEGARGAESEGLSPLFDGARSSSPALRAIAVRGLGRMERAGLADSIVRLLDDSDPDVRAEAANALAQASRDGASTGSSADGASTGSSADGGSTGSSAAIESRILAETEPRVLAALAESLGRLPVADSQAVAASSTILAGLAVRDSGNARAIDPTVPLGAARGFFFLTRQPAARAGLPESAVGALAWLARTRGVNNGTAARRVRSVATAALAAVRALRVEDVEAILTDPDPLVRREAVAAIATVQDPGVARHIAERALTDDDAMVRYDALRMWDRVRDTESRCQATLDAVHDANAHVALLAIDLLGSDCGGQEGGELLDSIARTLASAAVSDTGWHRPAHAMVSLARLFEQPARERQPAFLGAANGFVRAYGARAAASLKDVPALATLASDTDPNVRTEAVRGLSVVVGHAADTVYIAQLRDQNDSQLLQAAAAALDGSKAPGAAEAVLGAFERVSTAKRETWRDSRVALLGRLGQLGTPALASRLQPWLQDYDPVIADSVASLIGRWTGRTAIAAPQRLPRLELPTPADVEAMVRTSVIIEMQDGGQIEIELYPFVAPTNAWRFARLARDGYFNGLTLHRVVPNFVVQGGSPAANEYTGDGPFTRDELGLSYNWRGTIGLSTRGRDTGDGQLYFNLIDNVRLDHDYTIWGRVTAGMPVVDALLEGAVMRSVRLKRVRR